MNTAFGIYSTWEGLSFQFAAMVFVIGSYYLAEGMRKHKLSSTSREFVKSVPETQAKRESAEF